MVTNYTSPVTRITFSSTYYKYVYSSDIPNIITYLDKTFKEEKNDNNFKMELFYLIGVNFGFIYQVSDA